MLQLPQRLRLDLPDALAGHGELLAHFFQRVVGVHAAVEAHYDSRASRPCQIRVTKITSSG